MQTHTQRHTQTHAQTHKCTNTKVNNVDIILVYSSFRLFIA